MGCCSWFNLLFGHSSKKAAKSAIPPYSRGSSQEHLLGFAKDEGGKYNSSIGSVNDYVASSPNTSSSGTRVVDRSPIGRNVCYDETSSFDSCQSHTYRNVHYTRHVIRGEDCEGNKMINNYVREGVLGIGSYSKVVLCRNIDDGVLYAMKIVQKSRLRKIKVAPSETALTDVFKEVSIMRELDHPNIVKLMEVIDDPECDRLYMILEYVEGRCMFEGSGPPGGIGDENALGYFRDVVSGLMYLHSHRIIHGDIKPENLLVTASGRVKICDFSVSQRFEGNNDELRRSPGTPVYTAPECILGPTYHGRTADVWALGVTVYCMLSGRYPFIGDTLQSTYDEIVQSPLKIPEGLNPQLVNLLEGLLCKDPNKRMTLDDVVRHPCFLNAAPW